MSCTNDRPALHPLQDEARRISRTVLERPHYRELFLSSPGCAPQEVFAPLAEELQQAKAHILSVEVFGLPNPGNEGLALMEGILGPIRWPVTWVQPPEDSPVALGGAQVWAIAGADLAPIELDGAIAGLVFEDEDARYCRLGGIEGCGAARPRPEQAKDVLERMEIALGLAGMDFSHVLRTWFYNHKILEWYDEFNRVRNQFFEERGVFEGLVPASTGVAGRYASGAALAGGLIAVRPKREGMCASEADSPLQRPALDYGSSFSRAVEMATDDHRRLFVSGTASINPAGETIHLGDVDAQTRQTLKVVHAILEARGMGWKNVSRALAYFKYAQDAGRFEGICRDMGIPSLPLLLVHHDICRDDLLFEIELDAVIAGGA